METRTRCAVISPSAELRAEIATALQDTEFHIHRQFESASDFQTVLRFLRPACSVLLIDSTDLRRALQIAEQLEHEAVSTELVAFSDDRSQDSAVALMRAGIREYVRVPLRPEELLAALERAKANLAKRNAHTPAGDVYSFLPAKAGSGASTIVANTSLALARMQGGTLAADLDVHSGVLGFMLRVDHNQSIQDAFDNLGSMDDALWDRLTAKRDELAILPADACLGRPALEHDTRDLIAMMRRMHKTVCLDLPDSLQPHVLSAIDESQRSFIVCTQDLVTLHLARKKVQRLRALGLERLSLIVNRYEGRYPLNTKQIEEVVGAPVEFVFSNNYKALLAALSEDSGVSPSSRLGQEFRAFAARLSAREVGLKPRTGKRRFVEYFWVSQGPIWSLLSEKRS
ncbi:MAG TPA: hypothetical protein VMJ34_23240 [Bryobacteraceae bacterium]|nr:hypothetical protein [Bryobacteraceae bacterium]